MNQVIVTICNKKGTHAICESLPFNINLYKSVNRFISQTRNEFKSKHVELDICYNCLDEDVKKTYKTFLRKINTLKCYSHLNQKEESKAST